MGLPSVLCETDSLGTVTAYYVYGLGLISKIIGTAAYFYQYDGLGSTVAITDKTGAIKNKYAYDDFGNVATNSTEAISNPFKYVGKFGVMTDAPDLLYMRARYYIPSVGRFSSEDPIGLAGGVNLYGYVGGNAINAIDPLGLSKTDVIIKGAYRFVKYVRDTYHGGPHWHVYLRRTGELLGRVNISGKILSGSIPKTAIKILANLGKIGGAGIGVGIGIFVYPSDSIAVPSEELNNHATNATPGKNKCQSGGAE